MRRRKSFLVLHLLINQILFRYGITDLATVDLIFIRKRLGKAFVFLLIIYQMKFKEKASLNMPLSV